MARSGAAVELTVITKTYDLILWSCHHTGKFPRNHRFVLGERPDPPDITSNQSEEYSFWIFSRIAGNFSLKYSVLFVSTLARSASFAPTGTGNMCSASA